MVGGGEGAFIGAVHRIAARIDDRFELVAGAQTTLKTILMWWTNCKKQYNTIDYIYFCLSKQLSTSKKNRKSNFIINTDQQLENVEREVIKIIKILEKKYYG